MKLKNQVPVKYLSKMAFLGLDESFSALQGRRNCPTNIMKCDAAKNYRPRYKKNNLEPKHAKAYTQIIPKEILNIPFKSILQPIGKGEFKRLSENLPRTIKVQDVINHIHGDTNIDKLVSNVSQFKPQAISSISFHSQIYKRYGKTHIERDVLDYVFSIDENIESIIYKLFKLDKHILENIKYEKNNTKYHPIKNLTVDSVSLIGRWNNNSFDQLMHEVKILPRVLGVTDRPIDIDSDSYPGFIKKLSVLVIAGTTHRQNIKNKMHILHKVGLCHVHDLELFSKKIRVIFTDRNIRKKILRS